ncbi:hypothetical protein H0E87_029435, partial [Populus deltoides]
TVQGLLQPPLALSESGHCPLISAAHLIPRQLPDTGLKSMGTLNPSTRDMSKKSKLLNRFKAYSASVFGGCPKAWHCKSPLQSPVSHVPHPAPSKLHLVHPQIRACVVPAFAVMVHDSPGSSLWPPPGTAAAHTV